MALNKREDSTKRKGGGGKVARTQRKKNPLDEKLGGAKWLRESDYEITITPDDLYVPTKFKGGETGKLFTTLPNPYARRVAELVQSGEFPFKTNSDFVRWAVVMGLKLAEEMDTPVRNTMGQLGVLEEIAKTSEYQKEFDRSFQLYFNMALEASLQPELEAEAAKKIAHAAQVLRDMPRSLMRVKYIAKFRETFGQFLKSKNQLRLLDGLHDER